GAAARGGPHDGPPRVLLGDSPPVLDLDLAVVHDVVPDVEHGHLVEALVLRAPGDELRAVPVALPVELVLEPRHLQQLVGVVARAVDLVLAGPVAQRVRRDLAQRLLEPVAAPDGRVPGDVNDSGHQAPTSARMAPGPSAVRPSPSDSAPTRIAILP